MHRPNSVGESGHPCLTPIVLVKKSESLSLIRTQHITFSYIREIASIYSGDCKREREREREEEMEVILYYEKTRLQRVD